MDPHATRVPCEQQAWFESWNEQGFLLFLHESRALLALTSVVDGEEDEEACLMFLLEENFQSTVGCCGCSDPREQRQDESSLFEHDGMLEEEELL